MTPKEKAEKLYNIFDMIIYSDQDEHDQCKRCAIRCVDEMLKMDLKLFDIIELQEVKQEINKL